MLAQQNLHLPYPIPLSPETLRLQRSLHVIPGQSQPGLKSLLRYPPVLPAFFHRIRRRIRGQLHPRLPETPFVIRDQAPGREPLGTGEILTQAAGTAGQSVHKHLSVLKILVGGAAHKPMGLNGMPQRMAGTETGTGLALAAAGGGPLQVYGRVPILAPHQSMGLVQYNHRVGSLCHQRRLLRQIPHHRASHQIGGILRRNFPCQGNHIPNGGAQRHPHRQRMLHLPHHGDKLVHHGNLQLQSPVNIVYRLHIEHRSTLLNGQSPGTYHPARGLIDQHHLVPHGIGALQQVHAHIGVSIYISVNGLSGPLVFSLYADNSLFGPHCPGHQVKSTQNFFRMLLQKLSVELQEGLTFGAVEQDDFCAHVQFPVSRETCPSCPCHTRLPQDLF